MVWISWNWSAEIYPSQMLNEWSHRGSCETSHNPRKRHRQSTSISRTLSYGKWWFWAKVSVANLKSLHMLRTLKCNLEPVEFWQEISSQEPWMCGWLVKTAYLHSLLRGLAFPRSFIIFIGYFSTSVYKSRVSFQSTIHPLWKIFRSVCY